jgi:hypothetical protein
VVTASPSPEPKGQFKETGTIRDYECAICGYKQKVTKLTQNTHVIDKVRASVKKTKKSKPKSKPKPKTKAKRKRTK